MSSIRVYRDEANGKMFPDLCIRCGAEAELTQRKKFVYTPPWVHVFILAGLLPWALLAMLLRKEMTIRVPLCRQHKWHWHGRILFAIGGLFAIIFSGIGAIVIATEVKGVDLDGPLIFGFIALFIGWLVGVVVSNNTCIRPKEITNRWADLIGVSEAFAEAWDEIEPPPPPPRRKQKDWDDEWDD